MQWPEARGQLRPRAALSTPTGCRQAERRPFVQLAGRAFTTPPCRPRADRGATSPGEGRLPAVAQPCGVWRPDDRDPRCSEGRDCFGRRRAAGVIFGANRVSMLEVRKSGHLRRSEHAGAQHAQTTEVRGFAGAGFRAQHAETSSAGARKYRCRLCTSGLRSPRYLPDEPRPGRLWRFWRSYSPSFRFALDPLS